MIDPRLKVTEELLAELRKLKEEGADNLAVISFLHASGVPKMGGLIALRRAAVMPVEQTKAALHNHPAYAGRKEADEQFEESLLRTLPSLQEDDRVIAA